MSRVIAIVGAGNANNVQVKQSTGLLNFEVKIPDANADTMAAVMARLNAIKVNVDLQRKSGSVERQYRLEEYATEIPRPAGSVEKNGTGAEEAGR